MVKTYRNLIGTLLILLSSCATKKQNTFNFGGGRDYTLDESIARNTDKSEEVSEIVPHNFNRKSVISVKSNIEDTPKKRRLSQRFERYKATSLRKNQFDKTGVARAIPQRTLEEEPTKKKRLWLLWDWGSILIFASLLVYFYTSVSIQLPILVLGLFLALIYRYINRKQRKLRREERRKLRKQRREERRKEKQNKKRYPGLLGFWWSLLLFALWLFLLFLAYWMIIPALIIAFAFIPSFFIYRFKTREQRRLRKGTRNRKKTTAIWIALLLFILIYMFI